MTAPTLENLPACPVETTLLLIGNKWQVLILRELSLIVRRSQRCPHGWSTRSPTWDRRSGPFSTQ